MMIQIPAPLLAIAAAVTLSLAVPNASAQSPAHSKKSVAAAPKGGKKAAPKKAAELAPPQADADQIAAAEQVFYGHYDCEFKLSVDIVASTKYPAYVDVRHEKGDYLMKPVLSSTGAIRLEDTRGETLMVQISSKSMLLNVKTGHRLVDDCVSPGQRELIESARVAKASDAASAAASSASAPTDPTPPAAPNPATVATPASATGK